MRLILFLLLMLPVIAFSQSKGCPEGNRYHPGCKVPGQWDDCVKGYSPYYDKKTKEQWCTCDALGEDFAKSFGLIAGKIKKLEATDKRQNAQISEIQNKNYAQDAEIENIKGRVSNLETRSVEKPETVSGFKGPEKIEKKVEKLEEKMVPPSPPAPKKEDPDPGPAREAPTETVAVPPSFFVEPELGLFATKTNSPEFNSKWLYSGEVGIRFLLEPHNWHGFGIFAHPKYIFGLNKSFIPESDGTAYVQPLENKSGFLIDACLSYKPKIKYTEIFTGYAIALTRGAEHHSGFLGGVESGWDFHSAGQTLQLRVQLGLVYKHDLSFFGGVIARFPLGPKNKAPG